MTDYRDTENAQGSLGTDSFEIGGENLFREIFEESLAPGSVQSDEYDRARSKILREIRTRVGTLLKADRVAFLLGAGASIESGGVTIGSVPLLIEQTLHEKGILNDDTPYVYPWLRVFYSAVKSACGGDNVSAEDDFILRRRAQLRKGNSSRCSPLAVNFEEVLSILHKWQAVLSNNQRLRVKGVHVIDIEKQELDECLLHATQALAKHCELPTEAKRAGLLTYKTFLRKLLTRPLNLKRVNIFTLNYDTLVEQASDAEGVETIDGFVGTIRRIFRPESYEKDMYFPGETTEGRVHRYERVLHLYKLHGSISWIAEEPSLDNPYGVEAVYAKDREGARLLIYPTPAKIGETLGMPYAELFRRFAGNVAQAQSVLFTVGYGFGDQHVNAIIRQALALPSFTLVIVDPCPNSRFVRILRKQKDRRVWIAEGALGRFSAFVNDVMPDLRDEEVDRKVMETRRALAGPPGEGRGDEDGN
ncbi:MAG: SIR2 family protein [Candidatus Poribacteria bacterium]|nr:SIR2 family protein [Candidatus Poribacteria bacterium]